MGGHGYYSGGRAGGRGGRGAGPGHGGGHGGQGGYEKPSLSAYSSSPADPQGVRYYKMGATMRHQEATRSKISEMTAKQLKTAIIGSIQNANPDEKVEPETPKKSKTSSSTLNSFAAAWRQGKCKTHRDQRGLAESRRRRRLASAYWMRRVSTARRQSGQSNDHMLSSFNNNSTTARNEIDTYADTCAPGSNFVPLHFTGRALCDVSPTKSNL